MNQINWDGLVLYNNEHSMFLVSVCTPSPEVAVAPARPYSGKPYYDHYDDAEIIICSSDWTGDRDIQIKIPQVGLFDPKIIKNKICQMPQTLVVAGYLCHNVLKKFRTQLRDSTYAKGAVRKII